MKDYGKKVGAMLVLMLCVIGALGGVGYLIAYMDAVEGSNTVVPILGVMALVVLAWDNIVDIFKSLLP